ncbi:MAG: hypothetical protein R6U96_05420 [Promethearchaeia archaeon]
MQTKNPLGRAEQNPLPKLKFTTRELTHNDSSVRITVNTFGEDVRLMLCQQSSMNYESTLFMAW